jgi:cytochrome c553
VEDFEVSWEVIMKGSIWSSAVALFLLLLLVLLTPATQSAPPQGNSMSTNAGLPWAYGFAAPASAPTAGGGAGAPAAAGPAEPPEDPDAIRHLPDTTATFTIKDIANGYGPADWYPGDHPAMPDIVAHGRKPAVQACGFCHYPSGKGRPNNAGPAGLPAAYILRQLQDFKDGSRNTADKRKRNEGQMIAIAKALTPDEAQAAATYFASAKWTPYEKVVEADTVPKSRFVGGGGGLNMTLTGAEAGVEPIGDRIVEIPTSPFDTEPLRNPRSGFIAYVPPGTLAKGKAIVDAADGNSAGNRLACATCHGEGLQGLVAQGLAIPSLAGRSPSYLARQMNDFKQQTRKGPGSRLMQPVVQNLSDDNILAVVAYVSSLNP